MLDRFRLTDRPARRAVRRYLRDARTAAPALGAASTDETLVRIGAMLAVLSLTSDLDEALAEMTHLGADPRETASLVAVASTHLGPILFDDAAAA